METHQTDTKKILRVGLIFTFLLISALILSSCSLFPQKLYPVSTEEVYRHDLRVKVNGVEYKGVGVLPVAAEYNVEVFPAGHIDRLMWRMCDGEDVLDNVEGDTYKFKFKPTELETKSSCGALQITVLEEKKRRNGFALLFLPDKRPEVSVPATVICNKESKPFGGVSVCQSAAGLYAYVQFGERMIQRGSEPNCDVMKPVNPDEDAYIFSLAQGECNYWFVSKSRKLHFLTTIGYTDVLPEKR